MCKQILFAALLPQARAHAWSLSDLADATGAGTQCGLCRPYLRRMLLDGVTEFHALLTPGPEDAAR